MYDVRFIAHNQPAVNGVARTALVSRHSSLADAREAARNYGLGAAGAACQEGRDAVSAHAGDGVVVYVDGFTLWSEFYVEESE